MHKRDEHAVDGWDPEEHPRSVLSGRTNDEVAANPERLWTRDGGEQPAHPTARVRARATRRGARGARRAPREGARGRCRAASSRSPTSTRCCSRGRRRRARSPSATWSATTRRSRRRCSPTSRAGRSTCSRFPERRGHEGLLAEADPRPRARLDHAAGTTPKPIRARASSTSSPTAPRRWPGSRTRPRSSCTRGRRASRRCGTPTYALIDLDPGTETTWDELLVLARLHRTALEHLGVRGYPKVTGQRGHPDLDPDRRRSDVRARHARGSSRSRGRSARPCPTSSAGSGQARPRRPGPARLHPERDQQDARRALQHAPGAGRAGLGRRSRGTSSTIPTCARTGGRSATVLDRLAVGSRSHGTDAHRRAAPPAARLTSRLARPRRVRSRPRCRVSRRGAGAGR